jgi:hypothetical protein
MFPTVGRIVHFVHEFPARTPEDQTRIVHLAAIITWTAPEMGELVTLTVFPPANDDHHTQKFTAVDYDGETMRPGTWHWPERVPE